MDEEDYHRYMSEVHAPLVKDLMVKYGMIQWSMVDFSRCIRSDSRPIKLMLPLDAQYLLHEAADGPDRWATVQ